MYCTNCGKKLLDSFEYCPECGKRVIAEQKQAHESHTTFDHGRSTVKCCSKCGEIMPVDSFYCLNCGNPFSENTADFETIVHRINMMTGTWCNKWVALCLCFLVGWLGIHRFYEGKTFTGILYFCTFGLFGIGWFIDIIRIIMKPNPYRAK